MLESFALLLFRPARTRNLQSQYHLFQHQYQHAFLLLLQLLQHIWLQQLRLLLLRVAHLAKDFVSRANYYRSKHTRVLHLPVHS